MNPMGPDGKILTCRCCGSYRHLVAKCPQSWENLFKTNVTERMAKVNITEDEHAVLFTGYHKGDCYTQSRAPGCMTSCAASDGGG